MHPIRASFSTFAFVALLAASTLAQSTAFDAAGALLSGKPEKSDYRATVEFQSFTSLMRIPAKLGERECRMVFDTGAPMVVTPRIAKELALPVLGKFRTRDGGGRAQEREFVALPRVEIGGVGFVELAAIVIDLDALPELAEQKIDGLVGGNLLRHGAASIDHAACKIDLAPTAGAFETKGWLEVPFAYSVQALPILALSVGDTRVEHVELDTGANSFLDLPAELAARIGVKHSLAILGNPSLAAFGPSPQGETLAWLDSVTLSSTQLPGMVVSFVPQGAAKVGNRFFERTKLVLDWPAKKLFVADPRALGRASLATPGVSLRSKDGETCVATVLAGSPAHRAQLEPGMRVFSVDEIELPAGDLSAFARAAARLRDETRESATLVIERAGSRETLKLARERVWP
ncbi:MAG: aspartyl protease family protein [Planctomycetes bacterium]|nr:aspartyl protease family protein [Planctomycetota bacterium]